MPENFFSQIVANEIRVTAMSYKQVKSYFTELLIYHDRYYRNWLR